MMIRSYYSSPWVKEKALISGLLYQNDLTKVYGNICLLQLESDCLIPLLQLVHTTSSATSSTSYDNLRSQILY